MDTKPSILYVDDEPANLVAFHAAFRHNYTIFTADSAAKAIEILNTNRDDIQLILTDQRMPDITGVEFLESILTDHPDPIRMLLTGFSDISVTIDAINKAKVYKYLTKPWDAVGLKMILDEGIQLYNNNRQEKKKKNVRTSCY